MKVRNLLGIALFSTLLFSCNDLVDQQGEIINVKLSPTFLTISQDIDQPMNGKRSQRSGVDPNQVIYAIQVYENDSAYCYGLFDNVSDMEIGLMTEKNYQFKIAAFKVGTGKGLKQEVIDGIKYLYFPSKVSLTNKFYKGNALKEIDSKSSVILAENVVKDYPEIDGFYCEKSVKVEKGLENIDFSLFRMGFGVTYNVDRLTNGVVFVMMGNDTIKLTPEQPTNTSIRLFNSDNSFAKIFNRAETFSDSILVKVRWEGTNGTVLNLESNLKFTRNFQKIVNIQLNTSGLSLNFENWNNVPINGLIGWWPFNGDVKDASEVGNPTENFGANLTTDRYGRFNNAFSFDGKTSFIEILPKSIITSINDFTISLWAKNEGWQNQTSNRQYLFDGHAGNKTDPGNYLRQGFMLFSDKSGDSTNITSGILFSGEVYSDGFYRKITTLTASNFFSQWHNIVLVRKGNKITTYIDNRLYQSGSGETKDQALDMLHPWYIGAFCGNNPNYYVGNSVANYSYCGKLDDVRIYNRALSESELTSIYEER